MTARRENSLMLSANRLSSRSGRALICLAAALLAGLWLAAWAPGSASAQSAIRVVVNGEPITTYEVRNRARLLELTTQGRLGERHALEELIDEQLKTQEARRRNVRISDSHVEQAFAQIATSANMAPDQLAQALREAGVNPATLMSRIRAEMAWSEVVRARFQAQVQITDRDIAEALAVRGGDEAPAREAMAEYHLQPILFIVPERASQGYAAQRRSEADAFRSRFQGCDQALEQTRALRDVVVQPMIRRDGEQLDEDTQQMLAAIPVGGLTRPERVERGYQMVAVCAKRELPGQIRGSEQVRAEILNERGQLLARRYLRDLRADAIIDHR
jgi:peptidyl-prolyl cis-trans isomerase SurA